MDVGFFETLHAMMFDVGRMIASVVLVILLAAIGTIAIILKGR